MAAYNEHAARGESSTPGGTEAAFAGRKLSAHPVPVLVGESSLPEIVLQRTVDRIIPDFADAGATYITFHPEASEHIDRSLQLVRDCGCKSGLVFNPATPLDSLDHVLDKIDMILLMSVNPGFGGQKFIGSALPKLRRVREIIDGAGLDIRLEIDGGVGVGNIGEIAEAGADTFVSGSAIFGSEDYPATIAAMRAELARVGG